MGGSARSTRAASDGRAAYGVRTGIHVGVDVFINLLGVERRRKVILFGLLCGALFTGVIGSLGSYPVWHIGQIGQVSQDLELPTWIGSPCPSARF